MNLPPINLDAEILQFPREKRQPPDENAYLQPVPVATCHHFRGPFEVDVDGAKCKCLACGGEVSPIFVLRQLMLEESQWMRTRAAYQDEMQRLKERSRTKCQHCGQITRISRS
jgi:hypothetical protein